MIKLEKVEVMNIENAIRGARNPMNSWDKSDSVMCNGDSVCCQCRWQDTPKCKPDTYILGDNDLSLVKRLCKAGSDHRKFLRQIFVTMDITAPLYWWKEYDTYKVGTTTNSQSTMHKIHSKEIGLEDFSIDNFVVDDECIELELNDMFVNVVADCEFLRKKFIDTKDKKYWKGLIQLLPSSYNQMRTCTMTYENLVNMYFARKNHKLDEWHYFCDEVEQLPYMKEILDAVASGRKAD